MSIKGRIERAEAALNVSGEPVVHKVVLFGNGPLPPERTDGNSIVRYVWHGDAERAEKPEEGSH
ncbi:MAG: hypothetical protein ACYTAS_22895 [Planctomycetota bacterium]|jgi:hypothetical protein